MTCVGQQPAAGPGACDDGDMKRAVAAVVRTAFDAVMFLFGVGLVVSLGRDAFQLHTPWLRVLSGVFALVLAAALVVAVRNIALDARDRRLAHQRA